MILAEIIVGNMECIFSCYGEFNDITVEYINLKTNQEIVSKFKDNQSANYYIFDLIRKNYSRETNVIARKGIGKTCKSINHLIWEYS